MARSSADDVTLRKCCELAIIDSTGAGKQDVVLSIRVAKSRGKGPKLGRHAKPIVICLTTKSKGKKTKAFLRVMKDTGGGLLEPTKIYKLKHLSKMEVIQSDPSGCTFLLGFDNRGQGSSHPQWTMQNKDDRNRVLICILNICKEYLGRLPKVVGVDLVEMALWAKEYAPPPGKGTTEGVPDPSVMLQSSTGVAVESDLVSQAEEEDMEALLGTYVMGIGEAEEFSERLKRELLALEAANVHSLLESEPIIEEVLQGLEVATLCVDHMDEWLTIFNVKLRHMREDIESIESRNNKLELQSVSNKLLIEELDKIVELFCIPPKYMEALTGGSFEENNIALNIEACDWLTGALRNLEVSRLDPCYAKMKGMKEKRAELLLIKCTFVGRASEFLRNYFPNLVDLMINDKSCFSQRGQLKRPDHADLRYKCRTYARILLYVKSLDKNCLAPLRKSYCHSLNLLLRREAREFANELRASVKVPKNQIISLDGPICTKEPLSDTVAIPEAYSKMLTVFIPLLVDESAFFAHFMCFDVAALSPSNASADPDSTTGNMQGFDPAELGILSECLKDLIAGLEEDFISIVDWGFKIDPLCCIAMHGITERYLSAQKAETSGFVHLLLDNLETRITMLFTKFIDDSCCQVEKAGEKNVRQIGVLPFIPRFAILASRMEQYIQGQSRDLIDQAYLKLVTGMFVVLEKAAQVEPKYVEIVLLENYAAFQNSLYELANVVPILAKFYHQASECYEQACVRHVSMVIYVHFEKLFQFARKIEELMFNIAPEEIPSAVGTSKADLRKMLKSSLSGLDKVVNAMYRKLQKNITSEELVPSLWDKCKKEFLEKYGSFVELVNRIYPNEPIPTVQEMRDALAAM